MGLSRSGVMYPLLLLESPRVQVNCLSWQTEPRAISGSWAAEVRLSTPPALTTFECPRDEFCSYRVLKLCPKERKTLFSRIYPVLLRGMVFLDLGAVWTS